MFWVGLISFFIGFVLGGYVATLLGSYLFAGMHKQAVENNAATVKLLGWTIRNLGDENVSNSH